MSRSPLEALLLLQLRAEGLPEPEREHRFATPRRWRFDLAWPEHKLAVEVEGGQWLRGRHQTPTGFERDCEKLNAAALLGWTVLRVTSDMVQDGRARDLLVRAFRRERR